VRALIVAGVAHGRIAKQSGVKLKALVNWLEEGEQGNGAVQSRIAAWLADQDNAARQVDVPGLVNTPTSAKIEAAFEYARSRQKMAIVCGGAGCGKTSTAQRYMEPRKLGRGSHETRLNVFKYTFPQEDDGKRGVFYVEPTAFERTRTAIVTLLADALNVDTLTFSNRTDTLARRIRDYLRPGDLLIIDESQHLEIDALDGVRSFHDRCGVGLVFMGNETVYHSMTKRTRRAEFAQLYSRVGYVVHVPAPDESDVDAVLESWGARGRRERDFAQQLATGPGGLRSLANMLEHATLLAGVTKRPLDVELMQCALETMPQGQ
jgi:DNA transposition AAA+ family ATPase